MSDLTKQAAAAIRDLVGKVEQLEQDKGLFTECVKIAFELAEGGQIESDQESIIKQAQELFNDKDQIPVVKKALQYNTDYTSVGSLEKKASVGSENAAEDNFMRILMGN